MAYNLLTTRNPKAAKGEGYGYVTHVLHLAPADLSGYQVCSWASAGCRAACLNTAGRGGIKPGYGILTEGDIQAGNVNNVQAARIRKTRWFFEDRPAFMARLVREVEREVRKAREVGVEPVFRLNATSDIPWESIKCERGGERYASIMAAFPDVQFYDYTKIPMRPKAQALPNYDLTFSLNEANDDSAALALANGMNVAAVFRNGLPESYSIRETEAPVVDGDKSDLRFLDPEGVIVGLKAKGHAKNDASGFVREAA